MLSTTNETNLLNMSLPSFKFLSNHSQMETKLLLSNSSLFHKWWPTKSKWSQQWLHSSCCWWHGAFTDFHFFLRYLNGLINTWWCRMNYQTCKDKVFIWEIILTPDSFQLAVLPADNLLMWSHWWQV